MTTRLSVFDSPMFLGFDHFEQTIDRLKKSSDGYPPYNIEQTGDHDLRITLAVAGFTMDDLDVEIENNQLTVRGKQTDEKDRVFLHRGIAARQFQRSFVLAEGIEIKGASLDSGLLHIDMEQIIPESQIQKIKITGKSKPSKSTDLNHIIDVSDQKK
ncbi:MAG: heat-shock protein Hsp20 [Alphaproteobacteria bacterium]|nr:MAG: heat-shock protein Hsp20 [Alphaproteobacteria bacterium]